MPAKRDKEAIRTTIYLDKELFKFLKQYALDKEIPRTKVIEDHLRELMAKQGKGKK